MLAGVDEAGRGAVMGPLVIGIAVAAREVEKELKEAGVKDSKLLSPSARERLVGLVRNLCTVSLVKISARELNELMKKHSLNEIEAMKIGQELNRLEFSTALVDSPDPQPEKFEKRIRKYYSGSAEIRCENKADFNYAIVGAASIAAKVERDAEMGRISRELGADLNSGYPSDEITISFLEKNWKKKEVQKYLRMEWQTLERFKQRKLTDKP